MLNEKERALALARIDADRPVKGTEGRKERTTLPLIWRAFNFNVSQHRPEHFDGHSCACFLMNRLSFALCRS